MNDLVLEQSFTSTGDKFWCHESHMTSYVSSTHNTVISTHVSPEGSCNLKCSYCSVSKRGTKTSRIEMSRIQKYVIDLQKRGLKAVILTGGGEPTLYPEFNRLVRWLKRSQNLSVALITNGTTTTFGMNIDDDVLGLFSWIRVSVNTFHDWERSISLRTKFLDPSCVVGLSYVVDSRSIEHHVDVIKKTSELADRLNAQYVRIIPNCLHDSVRLKNEHEKVEKILSTISDKRFFHQRKSHDVPKSTVCHQSYFRPYLSEEPWEDGVPGSVYPCDSVVLNDSLARFSEKYRICRPEDVLEYIDGNVKCPVIPSIDCRGCVFTKTINMLDDWRNGQLKREFLPNCSVNHSEFV